MNNLLAWASMKLTLNDAIVYPNFEVGDGNASVPNFKHQILASFYNEAGTNPGRDAVNFYQAFSNYLSTTAIWETILRMAGGGLATILWYIASVLSYFYAKLFGLLNISEIADDAGKANSQWTGNTNFYHIHELFIDSNNFGLAIFGLLLLAYAIGTIINSPSFQRWKNIIRNGILITFFLFILPWATSNLADGVQSVATNMFGDNGITQSTQIGSGTGQSNLATKAISDNVVSVPEYIEDVQPGQPIPDLDSAHGVYPEKAGYGGIIGVDAPVYFIDLSRMSPDQKDAWNGLSADTIPHFLHSYGSNSEMMNKQSLPNYANDAAQIEGNPTSAESQGETALGKNDTHGGWGSMTTDTDSSLANSWNNFLNHVNDANPVLGIIHGVYTIQGSLGQSDYAKNYQELFSYQVGHSGAGIGNDAVSKSLTSHRVYHLSATNDFESSVPLSKLFLRAYSYYHINWLGVYGQLVMIILIIGAYIFKLFSLMFKLVVMYVSSGIALFRNADNYQRIKNWMRDLFSIYEAAFMDILMCYLALQILYPAYHDFVSTIMVDSGDGFLANPWTVSLIDIIGDCALWVGSIHGLNAVNAAIGSTGGGANAGGSGLFGSMIALRGANMAFNTAKTVGGTALHYGVGTPLGMAAGSIRRHHDNAQQVAKAAKERPKRDADIARRVANDMKNNGFGPQTAHAKYDNVNGKNNGSSATTTPSSSKDVSPDSNAVNPHGAFNSSKASASLAQSRAASRANHKASMANNANKYDKHNMGNATQDMRRAHNAQARISNIQKHGVPIDDSGHAEFVDKHGNPLSKYEGGKFNTQYNGKDNKDVTGYKMPDGSTQFVPNDYMPNKGNNDFNGGYTPSGADSSGAPDSDFRSDWGGSSAFSSFSSSSSSSSSSSFIDFANAK